MKKYLIHLRYLLSLLCFWLPMMTTAQLWDISQRSPMPEAVSNNAVVAAQLEDTAFVFSFGGIDSSKRSSGIHLRSFRYHTLADRWEQIADLPDTLGKIAAAASVLDGIIYIMGGYHVYANGREASSDRVHRYDLANNQFLSDGAAIPVPIDDHVQAVWRDSLIYLITGWSNVQNVPNVQIYNPEQDQWQMGTAVPNNTTFNSFGASGYIIADTIYYFGGAAFGPDFPIQNDFRKGVIDPQNPTQIQWTSTVLANDLVAYRAGAVRVYEYIHWLGGSAVTYNYDGIAYDGRGGVPPAMLNFFYHANSGSWNQAPIPGLPMDLRGIAEVSDEIKYIVGGMQANQRVSNACLRLSYDNRIGNSLQEPTAFWQAVHTFPQPAHHFFSIKGENISFVGASLRAWDIQGKEMPISTKVPVDGQIDISSWSPGLYLVRVVTEKEAFFLKILKK